MRLSSPITDFLTQVGHFGDHSPNQCRFAPTLPHFTVFGAPLQRKGCIGNAPARAAVTLIVGRIVDRVSYAPAFFFVTSLPLLATALVVALIRPNATVDHQKVEAAEMP